jgi:hypothetical protein
MAFATQKTYDSFTEMLENSSFDRDRILEKIFKDNPYIKDYGDFETAFNSYFDGGLSNNANIDFGDIKLLFESKECKDKLSETLNEEEMEKLYGDGDKVDIVPIAKERKGKVISGEKVKIKSYSRRVGKRKELKQIKSYEKFKKRNFTPAENKYVLLRVKQGKTATEILKSYNSHFKEGRTEGSISKKVYTLRHR